jgi:hypothetical protein
VFEIGRKLRHSSMVGVRSLSGDGIGGRALAVPGEVDGR